MWCADNGDSAFWLAGRCGCSPFLAHFPHSPTFLSLPPPSGVEGLLQSAGDGSLAVEPRTQEEQCSFRLGRGKLDQLYTLYKVSGLLVLILATNKTSSWLFYICKQLQYNYKNAF